MLFLVTAVGCASKATPAAGVGFVPMTALRHNDLLPFHGAWENPDVNFHDLTEVYIAPVNMDAIRTMSWWGTLERRNYLESDLLLLQAYTQEKLEEAFRNDPYYFFDVKPAPSKKSLIVEFAITEIVPNKAILEALSLAGGPIAGGIGTVTGKIIQGQSRSTVAFEARIRDGRTGEIIAMYADRESEKGSVINVKSFSWYAHARSIIEEWSQQLVNTLNRKPGQKIADSKAFTFKPW